MPSLRERLEDIPVLAENLLRGIADTYGIDMPILGEDAMSALSAYQFPGNVRELENILERAITLCEDNIITPEDLNLTASRVTPAALVTDAPKTETVNYETDHTDITDDAGNTDVINAGPAIRAPCSS